MSAGTDWAPRSDTDSVDQVIYVNREAFGESDPITTLQHLQPSYLDEAGSGEGAILSTKTATKLQERERR